jgi:CHAT domain-containing protein
MKLLFFACLCFLFGSCRKTPAEPNSTMPMKDYSPVIAAAYKKNSIAELVALKTEIELLKCCDTSLALVYRRIGNVYNVLNQRDSAILATKKALSILQKLPHPDLSDLAKCQLNIGIYSLYRDELDTAILYLQTALPLFEQLKDSFNVFNTQNQLLRLHIKREDYEQATLIEKGIQDYVSQHVLPNDILKDWHSNLGLKALSLLKEDTTRMILYKQNIIFHYSKVIEYLAQKQDNIGIATIWINLSNAYIHCKDFNNAQKILNQALPIFKQAKRPLNEAKCLNNLAMCYYPQQPNVVKQLLLTADTLLNTLYNNKPHFYRTEIHSNLGNLHFDKKEYLQAAEKYQQAIEHACSGNKDYIEPLNQQKKFNFNAPEQLLYPLQRKAEALFQQYLLDKKVDYLVKSLKIYENLDDYITRTRGLMTADESKFAYSEKVVSVYENALLAAFTASQLDSKRYSDYMVRFMAHSKAAVLQESAQQDTAKKLANITPQSLKAEKAFRWEVAIAQKELASADSINAPNAAKNLLKATEKWDAFIQQLEKQYPIYYHSKYAGLKVLTVNQLQKKLTEDRAIIDYFWGQKTLYTTTMTQNLFRIDSMTITPVLKQQMDYWVKALHAEIVNDSVKNQLAQYSHLLYQQLLEKNFQKLPSQNKISRLTIIPDGLLNLLPFEALCQKPIKTWLKNDTSAALIWKYAISYAYSNTLLFSEPKKDTAAPKEFGGFGIGYKRKYVNENTDKKASGILRNAEKDVINARKAFPKSHIWTETDGNAHLESFYKNAPDCRMLYLSMHGVVNDDFPLQSGLIFTKEDSLQMLQLPDIQGLALPYNDLTILSACNTSLGKLRHGEGLISLSRAFSFIGARSLLTTRWSLDEDAGSDIIESFLKYVKQGVPKDIALQKAKQDYLNSNQSAKLLPTKWAATVLVGDIEPLPQSNSCCIWIVIGLILLILILWRLRNKSSSRERYFFYIF